MNRISERMLEVSVSHCRHLSCLLFMGLALCTDEVAGKSFSMTYASQMDLRNAVPDELSLTRWEAAIRQVGALTDDVCRIRMVPCHDLMVDIGVQKEAFLRLSTDAWLSDEVRKICSE